LQLKELVLDRYKPLDKSKAPELLFEIIKFRYFNWPRTYKRLRRLTYHDWNETRAKRILHKAQARGLQVFTGAYVVSNNRSKRPKIDLYCEALTEVRRLAPKLIRLIRAKRTIQNATQVLEEHVPCAGLFVAYEFASDLRWTPLLSKAADIMTWANAGPGAKRGIHWILCGSKQWPRGKPRPDYLAEMRRLLKESQQLGRLGKHVRPLELRDIEHSLCELDKYQRVNNGEGKPRSRYWPPGHPNRKPKS
jgi:hypothetical protein